MTGLRGRWPARLVLALVVAAALWAAGRAAGFFSAGQDGLRLAVTPSVSLPSSPLRITISGLRPGQRVTLTVRSTDSRHYDWKSVSTYTAGRSGTVNLAFTPSSGPSYRGVDPMGPVDFMSSSSKYEPLYYWVAGRAFAFDFTATSGTETASVTVQRQGRSPVRVTNETLAAQGFVGVYWAPRTPPAKPHAAVLLFGGSEGGVHGSLLAGTLASLGYPTLDIAYFKEPGLPQSLKDVPLEYFAKALRWLAARPGVDSHRLWVDGTSRGSEAALLLGVHYPGLVHGVVALVASNVVHGCPDCIGPAWTLNGRAVPYTVLPDDPHPFDDPAAVIPVARIHGPVFLDCGGADQVWSSCPYARAIMAELAAAHDPYPHVLMVSQEGGHGSAVDDPPYEPGLAEYEWGSRLAGATVLANEQAWVAQWPKLLAFLKN